MRIIRYSDAQGKILFASQQPDGSALEIDGDIYGKFSVSSRKADVKKLLAPIQPTAFFCIGLNYKRHAEEGKNPIPQYPVLFMKNPAAVQNPGDSVVLPTKLKSTQVDYECELAVVIGKACKNATKENALDYVLGYTCGNDVSARDWQKDFGGGQWCRGKTFDTFAPLGPCLALRDEIPNPAELHLRTVLGGRVMQESGTSDMIFDVPTIIAFLSGSTTLLPGTVILTGTPQGVGFSRKPPVWLKEGDTVTVEIDRIGSLTNPVTTEASC